MPPQYALDEEVKYIMKASVRVTCSSIARSKAFFIYHHTKKCLTETVYDPLAMAAACLNLSLKYNEEDIDMDDLLMVCFSIAEPGVRQSVLSEKFKTMKKTLTQMESFILRILDHDLSHSLAHEFLTYFLNDKYEELSLVEQWNPIVDVCMKTATDFYMDKDCLLYKAEDIATAVISAAFCLKGFYDRLVEQQHFLVWLKALSGTPETVIMKIIEIIYKICYVIPHFEGKKSEGNNDDSESILKMKHLYIHNNLHY